MDSMTEFFKEKKTGISAQEAGRSQRSKAKGIIESKIYGNYYDINDTIDVAQATNPNDEDHECYNQEKIFEVLERNADILYVSNDGADTLYVIVSHEGGQNFVRERPIYSGEIKVYLNVYELRLRCATINNEYRVSEYKLSSICCPPSTYNYPIVPTSIPMIIGTKLDVGVAASALVVASTPIYKCVTIRVRSLLSGASYVEIGNSSTQEFRLTNENDTLTVDWTSNVNNIYVSTDVGTAELEYIGG